MRIAKSVFNIAVCCILIVLAISFVRITLAGGNTDYRVSFSYVFETFTSYEFDAVEFYDILTFVFDTQLSALREFSLWRAGDWTGNLIIDKILGVFVAFYDNVKAAVNMFVGLTESFVRIIAFAFSFFNSILNILRDFIGFSLPE